MGTPHWGKLVQQGRAKAIGVPWNAEEAIAVFHEGVPADYVRRGCLTSKDYEALKKEDEAVEKKTGEKPLEVQDRATLIAKASKLGVDFTNDVTDEGLRKLISEAKKPSKKKK